MGCACIVRGASDRQGRRLQFSVVVSCGLQDKQGNTALHLAAKGAHCKALAALLHRGTPEQRAAVVLGANRAGQLPLHMAALRGCGDCCRVLAAAAPAALQSRDKRGATPAQAAHMRGHHVRGCTACLALTATLLASAHLDSHPAIKCPTCRASSCTADFPAHCIWLMWAAAVSTYVV